MTERYRSPDWEPIRSSRATVALSVISVRRAGIAQEWQDLLRKDPRGRRRHCTVEGLLVGMILCKLSGRRLQLTEVDRFLQGLEPHVLAHLGIQPHGPPVVAHEGRRATRDAVGRPTGRPTRRESYVAGPLDTLSTQMATTITCSNHEAKNADEQTLALNWERQQDLMYRLLWAPIPFLPPPHILQVDATGIRSFSADTDPDCGPVYQTPTTRDPLKIIMGYYGSVLSTRNLDVMYEYPLLAVDFLLSTVPDKKSPLPPRITDFGADLHKVAYLMLRRYASHFVARPWVAADAGYSFKHGWAQTVIGMGFQPVHQLNSLDTPPPGSLASDRHKIGGFVLVNAQPHCAYANVPLIPLPPDKPTKAELEDHFTAISEWRHHAAKTLAMDGKGITVVCGAHADLPFVRCHVVDNSLKLSTCGLPDRLHPSSA